MEEPRVNLHPEPDPEQRMADIVKRILEAGIPMEDVKFLVGQLQLEAAWQAELEKLASGKN
jgi:hypothetical protein